MPFFSLWHDSTWDWILVSRAIGKLPKILLIFWQVLHLKNLSTNQRFMSKYASWKFMFTLVKFYICLLAVIQSFLQYLTLWLNPTPPPGTVIHMIELYYYVSWHVVLPFHKQWLINISCICKAKLRCLVG